MNLSPVRKRYFQALLIAGYLIITGSCSRQLYPESSFPNIRNQAERQKMKDFMSAGIQKEINTQHINPAELIKTAEKYIGVPHCMGGRTISCMDCSGLLVTVFAQHSVQLPHNSEDQARYGKIVRGTEELKKGDLVFFIRTYRTDRFITHSGIYTGDNHFIHASSGRGVTLTSLSDPWWKEKFIFGTRVFE